MEFSQNALIEIGLSIAGYLAAGALWMVLYSLFTRGTTEKAAGSPITYAARTAVAESIGNAVREKQSLQYVDLRGTAPLKSEPGFEAKDNQRLDQYRRNRGEVIRLAREMLKDGRSQQQVRDLLPITDGELALLAIE
jgi:hypothetical protein